MARTSARVAPSAGSAAAVPSAGAAGGEGSVPAAGEAAARRLEAAALGLARARRDAVEATDRFEATLVVVQAGHLAERLVAGAACPVCGSEVHPDPAVASGVMDEELAVARGAAHAAARREQAALRAFRRAQAEVGRG